jgi:hypothetical protein
MRPDHLTVNARAARAAARQVGVIMAMGALSLAAHEPLCRARDLPIIPSQAGQAAGTDTQAQQGEGRATLQISAQVDRATVDVGDRLTLTITIEGDFAKAELQPFEFPKALEVVAQSRASNVSLRLGDVKRSVSLVYVLRAQEAGTFQLGPFEAVHRGKPIVTDPIQIVVNKPLLPPQQQEHQRYTL